MEGKRNCSLTFELNGQCVSNKKQKLEIEIHNSPT